MNKNFPEIIFNSDCGEVNFNEVKFVIVEITHKIGTVEIFLQLDTSQIKNEEDFFRKVCQVTYFLKENKIKDLLEFSISPLINTELTWDGDSRSIIECDLTLKFQDNNE